METVGYVLPETETEAQEVYDEFGPVAQEVVREIARSMEFNREEYVERVTSSTVETGRDAIFGSLLVVTTGSREDFDAWVAQSPYDSYEVHIEGSDQVDHIAWHTASMVDTIVAATYHDERPAAVATLRRIAWGRVYRPVLRPD